MTHSPLAVIGRVLLAYVLLVPGAVLAQQPQNLTASASEDAVDLSWDAPDLDSDETVECYRVYRDTVEIPDSDPSEQADRRLAEANPPPGNPGFTDEDVTSGVTYYYRVTADVAERGVSVSCGGPLTEETDFSNQASATPTAPVMIEITSPDLPVSDPVDAGSAVEVRAEVTNASEGGTELHYQRGGEGSFTTISMQGGNENFSATIPADDVTIRGVSFFVTSNDRGTTIRAPESGVASIRVTTDQLSFTQTGGTAQSAYRMVSFPTQLDEARLSSLFEDTLGPPDNTQWRLFAIGDGELASSDDYVERTNMSRILDSGQALWLITRSNATLDSGSGTSIRTDEPFRISLQSGWNLIGNPFAFDVPRSQLRVGDASGMLQEVFGYDGTFVPLTGSDVLEPFHGYLVHLSGDASGTLVIDPSAEGGEETSVAKNGSSLSWHLDVAARVERARDVHNTLGVARDATEAVDAFDGREPPPIGQYVSLSFHPPGRTDVSLWRDVRAGTQRVRTWTGAVRTNISGLVTLDVSGIQTVPDDQAVWLVDPVLDVTQNLRRTSRYQFSADGEEAPRRIRFVVGPSEAVQRTLGRSVTTPSEVELLPSAPHPVLTHTTLRYGVPDEARVTLELYDLLGRRVASLVDGKRVSAGYHTLSWTARAGGRALSSGTYLLRLQADDVTRTQRLVVVR